MNASDIQTSLGTIHPSPQTNRGPWHVIATSVQGTSHAKRGQPCQDAHYWKTGADELLVAAVADGAGSAVLGGVGAAVAAQAAVIGLYSQGASTGWPKHDEGWHVLLADALITARTALAAEAGARAVTARDLATTLLLVVATPILIAAAQVGDGAVIVGDTAGNLIPLTTPQSGEYLNETTFLTSSDALATAQLAVWHGAPAHLALLSDGLQMLALTMPAGKPHAPFFSPLFRFVTHAPENTQAQEELKRFLSSPRLTARTDDDVTLLLATLLK